MAELTQIRAQDLRVGDVIFPEDPAELSMTVTSVELDPEWPEYVNVMVDDGYSMPAQLTLKVGELVYVGV